MNNLIAKNLRCFSFTFSTIACLVATTSSHAQYTEGQLVRWGASFGGGDTNSGATSNSIGSTLPYIKVAGGTYHTVAIKADGSVAAWGSNDVTQCSVPSGLFGVVEVAGGERFSAAVKNDGTVVAWGANWAGQCLGSDADGDIIYPSTKIDATPVKILGVTLTSVAHISAGASNVLATKYDGTVVGWGSSGYGSNVVPADLQDVTQIASGYWHSLALKSNGTVVGWGNDYDYSGNWYGQATVPTDLSDVKKIAASMWHSVALKNDGTVVAWGGDQGALGFRWWRVPDAISTKAETTPITQMTTSEGNTTVVFSDGIVDGWSQEETDDDKHGEVPIEFRDHANPTCTVTQLGTGGRHTVAISSGTCATNGVICWGYNNFSQCDPPVSLMNVKQVAAGAQHTVVLKRAANGTNEIKCLGDRAYQQADIPANSIGNGFGNPIQISAGSIHSAALLDNGKVVSWGGYMDPAPLLPALATQIDCGLYTNVARLVDGTVVAWGYNYGGECLGTDETGAPIANSTTMPPGEFGVRSKLMGVVVSDVVQVAAGFDTVALKTNGTLVGWPNDLVTHWGMPSDLSNVMQIDVGNQYVALKIDGTVVCFPPTSIMPPEDLSGVTQVASGEWRSVALKLDGTVVSWGDSWDSNQTDPNGYFSFVAGGAKYESLGIADGEYLQCGNTPRPGNATLAVSGSAWQDHAVWQWSNGHYQTPGSQSSVNLGAYGSVGIDPSLDAVCEGSAGTLATSPGSTIIVNAYSELGSLVGPPVLKVTTDANLSGRLWLFTAGEDLPDDLDMPVLTCATANGYFDILQSDIAPPAGKFLTLVPSDVNGRTVFSLKLLPMPSAANLSSTTGASASGVAIAAESMDFNVDGFDDIALAVKTGSTGLVQVLMNDGLGNLGATSILKALPATPTALAVGDFSGDGTRNDVVVGLTDGTVRVYINNGTGFTAGAVVTLPPGEIPTCVCEIKPGGANRFMATSSDFAVGTSSSNLRTFGSGGGTGTNVPLSSVPRTVHSSDIDDDDLSDVTAAGSTSAASLTGALTTTPTGFLQVVRGTTNGFNAETPFEILGEPVSMQIADIDGDGLPDIVTANRNPQSGGAGSLPPVFALFRNNGGTNSFAGATPIAPAGASGGLDLALVDVNSDGVKDIVAVYKTTGANSQAALININTVGAGYPLSIGDSTVISNNNPTLVAKGNLDGNGSEDVFLVQQASQFAVSGDSTVAPFLGAQSAPCFGDLDGSGEVDAGDVSLCLLDTGVCEGCASDLDGSGEVDAGDVSLVLLSTGACSQ